MHLSWLSLLPPIVVVGMMFITHQLNISLIAGIISAALITAQGKLIPALSLCIQKTIEHFSDSDMLFLYSLLIVISSLVILLTVTGSAAGCARIISRKMKTARDGELATILLALLLSIDDYLSILTTGLVMGPMTDKLGIARTKLAYIIHALAGPLVIMVPISTWAAAILAQLDNAGINQASNSSILADPFHLYLNIIPFIFYSVFTLIAVFTVVLTRIRFGSIGATEKSISDRVITTDNENEGEANHSLLELLLPLVLLIGGVFLGILYSGNHYFFGGTQSFIDAFRQNNKTFLILLCSSLLSFGASIIIVLYTKRVTINVLPKIIYEGFLLIKSSIMMVILASILGSFLRFDLQTGNYLAYILLGKTPLFLIPVLLFIVSLLITLMTGSAWGTFSMLIPIAIQMLISFQHIVSPVSLEQVPLLFPVIGAVLSGAACGNHLSPFAETTFMTAAGMGIEPLEHAKTQFIYAVPGLIGTLVAFVLVGILTDNKVEYSLFLSFFGGMIVMEVLLIGLHYYYQNKSLRSQ